MSYFFFHSPALSLVLLVFLAVPFPRMKALEVIVLIRIFTVCTWSLTSTRKWGQICGFAARAMLSPRERQFVARAFF
jgi:hypothetical protein